MSTVFEHNRVVSSTQKRDAVECYDQNSTEHAEPLFITSEAHN